MNNIICGVDEVGRGCLCGPVIASSVILDPNRPIKGLKDSKKLSPKRRAQLYEEIKYKSISWSVGRAEVEEIDRLNILHASLLAMKRAVEALGVKPTLVLVDGIHAPIFSIPTECIIKGDETVLEISAASIIAKVTRDNEMKRIAIEYPQYDLENNKGYPTKKHLIAIQNYGVSKIYRSSFKPVSNILTKNI